jgi:hypothetical protein
VLRCKFLILGTIVPDTVIYVSMDVKIRGYISKPKGIRVPKRLLETHTECVRVHVCLCVCVCVCTTITSLSPHIRTVVTCIRTYVEGSVVIALIPQVKGKKI